MQSAKLHRPPDEELLMFAQQAKDHLAERFDTAIVILRGRYSDGEPCRITLEWGDGWTRFGLLHENYLIAQLSFQDAARAAIGPPPTWVFGGSNAKDD